MSKPLVKLINKIQKCIRTLYPDHERFVPRTTEWFNNSKFM